MSIGISKNEDSAYSNWLQGALYIHKEEPSKSDSAPVRGDLAYEPAGLRIQQSQRRDIAQRADGSWWPSRRRGQ